MKKRDMWIDWDWSSGQRLDTPDLEWIEPYLKEFETLDDRKARMNMSRVDKIDRDKVWARDNGICGICGESANYMNWHMDHIIPLGPGKHSYENVRVTHPKCNAAKVPEDIQAIRKWRITL